MRPNLLPILLGSLLAGSLQAHAAINVSKCSAMLNDGLYKKYQYRGIDWPLTKATKKHGTTKGSSVAFTESTTASVDPSYSWNLTKFHLQTSSFWGPCSLMGYQQLKEQREQYFAQNHDEILRDIATGEGEHLEVLAAYSMCDDQAVRQFSAALQKHTEHFIQKRKSYGDVIDRAVSEEAGLKANCHVFGS